MGAPKGYRGGDPAERFRDLQLEGAGKEALAALVHELKVHQEELSAQNHQLIETQSALEESRDRYVDLYDFAPMGYMTISPSGTIRELNLTAAAVLGRERGKIVGLPFSTFVLRADKPRFSEHLRQCQQAEQRSVTTELTLYIGNHLTSVQLVTRRHGGDTSGEPMFLTALIDITARRKLEQEHREAEDAREKLSREREFARARADAKDHFLAALSHELRTPLTPIVATMSDSRLISLAPEPLRAALQTARRNLDLEVRLIDDLLDVTRISRGRLQLTHEQIDLHQVIQEVIDMLSGETQRRGITIVTAFDAPQHSVVGDPVRLRQVFWNLLGNATKFTDTGGTVTIASSAGAAGFIQVTVSDTGIGMERDVIDRDQRAGRRRPEHADTLPDRAGSWSGHLPWCGHRTWGHATRDQSWYGAWQHLHRPGPDSDTPRALGFTINAGPVATRPTDASAADPARRRPSGQRRHVVPAPHASRLRDDGCEIRPGSTRGRVSRIRSTD